METPEKLPIKRWKIISALVLAVMIIIVALQNTDAVETRILFVNATMPRAVLLFVTFTSGVVVGLVVALKLSPKVKA